jgi:hypothetical protein
MEPLGPPSWSMVNVVLPLQVGGAEDETRTGYFALGWWVSPRLPAVGEYVDIAEIGHRVEVERFTWDKGAEQASGSTRPAL